MDAARITAGILKSKDGRFLIDLTANTITMKNPSGNTVFAFDGNGNLTISGNITATSGSIAGFTIYGDRLQGGNCTLYSDAGGGELKLGDVTLDGYGGLGINGNVAIDPGHLYVTGDLDVDGSMGSDGDISTGGNVHAVGTFYANLPNSSGGETVYWGTNTQRFVYHGSSRKYKKDITSVTEKEAQKILKLNPVTFVYKDDEEEALQHGLIAEEVYKLYPEMIGMKKGEIDSMHYEQLWAPLIKIVQMQDTRIKQLEESLKNTK